MRSKTTIKEILYFLKKRKASILLEALLSIVILSVSITLIIQSMTSSLRASINSTQFTTAIFLLENKMFEILQNGSIEEGIDEEDSFEDAFEYFKYYLISRKAELEEIEGLENNLNEVYLSVMWDSGNKTKKIDIETYMINEKE